MNPGAVLGVDIPEKGIGTLNGSAPSAVGEQSTGVLLYTSAWPESQFPVYPGNNIRIVIQLMTGMQDRFFQSNPDLFFMSYAITVTFYIGGQVMQFPIAVEIEVVRMLFQLIDWVVKAVGNVSVAEDWESTVDTQMGSIIYNR